VNARAAHAAGAVLRASAAPVSVPFTLPAETGVVLLAVWAALFVFRAARLGAGLWLVGRWARGARPVPRGQLYDACGYHVADIPVLEAAVRVPTVVGVTEPRILLPIGMAGSLPVEELGFILLHEEAHVRRRDPLWFLAAELAHAAVCWHPLAEVARRRLTQAAEDACDARVLQSGSSGPGYARTLLTVVERSTKIGAWVPVCPLGSPGAELRRRVGRILALPKPASRAMAAVAGSALVATTAVAGRLEVGIRPHVPGGHATFAVRPVGLSSPVAVTQLRPRKVRSSQPEPAATQAVRLVWEGAPADALPGTLAPAPGSAELSAERFRSPREGRTLVFLLDNSVAMHAFQQEARAGILEHIAQLSPADRFNVVALGDGGTRFAELPVTLSEDSLAGVRAWVDGLPEASAVDAQAGLAQALATPELTSLFVYAADSVGQGLGAVGMDAHSHGLQAQVFTVAFGEPSGFTGDPLVAPSPRGRSTEPIQADQKLGSDLRP
ncbi:MAG: blaR1 8, partial [Armatimonadetes bacterium]|nr:blaR1 8 [Armatimonadota bacterium]